MFENTGPLTTVRVQNQDFSLSLEALQQGDIYYLCTDDATIQSGVNERASGHLEKYGADREDMPVEDLLEKMCVGNTEREPKAHSEVYRLARASLVVMITVRYHP